MNDPKNPFIVNTLDIGGRAYGVSTVEIRDKIYAHVTDSVVGLKIIEMKQLHTENNPCFDSARSIAGNQVVENKQLNIFFILEREYKQ